MMNQELYSDGLISVSISGEVIRLDFGSQDIVPRPEGDGTTQEAQPMVMRQRIVMPLSSFAQSFGMQEQVMKRLIDDGLFRRADEQPVAAG